MSFGLFSRPVLPNELYSRTRPLLPHELYSGSMASSAEEKRSDHLDVDDDLSECQAAWRPSIEDLWALHDELIKDTKPCNDVLEEKKEEDDDEGLFSRPLLPHELCLLTRPLLPHEFYAGMASSAERKRSDHLDDELPECQAVWRRSMEDLWALHDELSNATNPCDNVPEEEYEEENLDVSRPVMDVFLFSLFEEENVPEDHLDASRPLLSAELYSNFMSLFTEEKPSDFLNGRDVLPECQAVWRRSIEDLWELHDTLRNPSKDMSEDKKEEKEEDDDDEGQVYESESFMSSSANKIQSDLLHVSNGLLEYQTVLKRPTEEFWALHDMLNDASKPCNNVPEEKEKEEVYESESFMSSSGEKIQSDRLHEYQTVLKRPTEEFWALLDMLNDASYPCDNVQEEEEVYESKKNASKPCNNLPEEKEEEEEEEDIEVYENEVEGYTMLMEKRMKKPSSKWLLVRPFARN